jgi:hypothetical protein
LTSSDRANPLPRRINDGHYFTISTNHGDNDVTEDVDLPPSGRTRSGTLMAFLGRDVFSVQLDTGVMIKAVMPAEFFSIYNCEAPLNDFNRPGVKVEMHEPPALPKIVDVWRQPRCGSG